MKLEQNEIETMLRLLRHVVDAWPELDTDDPVDGGDVVQWLALYRAGIKETLKNIEQKGS